MDIKELESFKLSDAVKFHDELNPELWTNDGKLLPEVYKKLMEIAEDFMSELGLSNLKVDDITISGSNAAYSYTPHSDLDLHILVDFNKLPDDEIYQELFNAKKTVYNDSHNIKVNGIPVELYVQNSNQPHYSLGEYSLLNKNWIKRPIKRRANFDQTATKLKYEKLGELIELALKTKSINRVEKALDIIKRYRKAGLEKTGEFGPENLAYKALRKKGYVQALWDLKQELHSEKLSLEDYHPNATPPGPEFKPTMPKGTVRVDVSDVYDWYKLGQHISNMKGLGKHDFGKGPPSTILSFGDEDLEHKYIDALKKTGLDTTDIDPIDPKQPLGMPRQKVDPTYNVNEILDKESASNLTWNEGESNELYNEYTATAKDKKNNILKYNFYEFPKYDLTAIEFSRAVGPWGDNYSIDKAGDQYTVFATLIHAIKNYLSSDTPEYIFFAAKEPSRVKLYQTFVNRFANQFGYKQISADNIPRAVSFTLYSSNDTPFLLKKVKIKDVSNVTENIEKVEGGWLHTGVGHRFNYETNSYPIYPLPRYRTYINQSIYDQGNYNDIIQYMHFLLNNYQTKNIEITGQEIADTLAKLGNKNPKQELEKFNKKHNKTWKSWNDFFEAYKEYEEKRFYDALTRMHSRGNLNVKEVLDTKSKAPFYNMGSDIDRQVPFKTKSGRRYGLDFINALDAHSRPRVRQFPKIKPKLLRYKDEIIDNGVEVVFGQDDYMLDNPTGITGTGSAAEVFGIVTNKIIEYIKKFNPPYLYFTSFDDEPSRVKLYSALLRRVMPTLPGYFYKVIKIENSYQFVIFDEDFFVGNTINEVSGYIPSEKEKNDPRFKTALTVDVKPDSIKKNAKAFGWKVSRTGRPPLLR